MDEIEEAIDEQVEYIKTNMPKEVATLIKYANYDLYSGPVYLDEEGNVCSFIDEGARPFNFKQAMTKVRDYLWDKVSDIQVECGVNEENEEPEYEIIYGTQEQIIKKLLGKELAEYL